MTSLNKFPYVRPNTKSNIPTVINPNRLNHKAFGSPCAPSLLIKSFRKLNSEFEKPNINKAAIKIRTDKSPKIPTFFSF